MKKTLLMLLGIFLFVTSAVAQVKTVAGKVTDEDGLPLPGVSISIKGETTGTSTKGDGTYSIRASVGQILQFRFIGTTSQDRTVGAENVINVQLRNDATALNEVVVTALGQTTTQRSLGTAQQSVKGADIAQTQRENFINALQGRIAGVEVNSSSGVPGASSSITIRGISSISGSNQPLMIIDGLPMDNKTLNTGVLASDAPGSQTAFNNRGVDFTNRSADLNPEDIESLVVLKGPEAAALYGIDAANGAIVITTKRGKPGTGGIDYNNSLRIEKTRAKPEIQQVYGPSAVGSTTFLYYGDPYAPGTQLYDNVDGFFQTALTQKHNLSFSGAAPDNSINYRLATSYTNQEGVVPNSLYDKINLTGASQAQIKPWLKVDLSMGYTYAKNDQSFKGVGGPLLGLLVWPQTDQASDYLTPAGTRRRLTNLAAASEVDNPYFNIEKNIITSKNNRILSNLGLIFTPFKWGNLRTNIGVDNYTNENLILRHPESAYGNTYNGVIDIANDNTRNISSQTIFNINSQNITKNITINGLLGNAIQDLRSNTDALKGQDFLEPDFVSVNNTNLRFNRSTLSQRRLVSAFGSATLAYKELLYVTVTGRNDWTSTIPVDKNSFFYPSVSTSFIFSDAFPSIGKFMTGKIRAAYAEVGKDARPYAYRPALEYKTTTNGGYGYGFTGPNLGLRPEFATSYEIGTELSFLDNRLGLDATVYRKQTKDQIVNDIRGSYATGYILFNLNGAETRNEGLELTLRGTPVLNPNFSWDILANFESARGKVLALPNALPESYVSDTWLFGNVRNGTAPGLSTRSLTGLFYLKNNQGQLLIDPTTGLPLRSNLFVDGGYDRQPDFSIGVTNSFRYKKFSLNFLFDIRKGGDVLNATEQFLTARGLSMRTLDRNEPRVVEGVLRDGKENSATPTANNIVVVPNVQNNFYTGISEELFIEKDINWVRLRDVTLGYVLPDKLLQRQNFVKKASVFVTGTDLLLFTNYSGLDPIVNGNSAAVGGSGAAGIDFGNFPIPQGINFGIRIGL
ncbi:MAG: SusC/RagA family TonB-linked outer membrane protein [Daejeonella sp.]|uniref:SusC/RagA family TonB-linked outer membrane protein n=1 Tax=Daejeonella sp. TaxID=2805397 RepID=UPI003C73E00A